MNNDALVLVVPTPLDSPEESRNIDIEQVSKIADSRHKIRDLRRENTAVILSTG
jgi:UDP-N-acetyl-D-mannosaminuronate dehydrogenase